MIVVASELYWPESTSTGRYLTRLAEGLARWEDVLVLCAQPTYSSRGQRSPHREVRRGVTIRRVPSTTLDKNSLLPRLINAAAFSMSMLLQGMRRVPFRSDVLVVTNPPVLPYVMALVAKARKARLHLLIHDVYPDAMIAGGLLRANGWPARAIRALQRWLFRNARSIIVLGRDMERLVANQLPEGSARPTVITHWMDDGVEPTPVEAQALLLELGLRNRFIVQYAGNMGRTHDLQIALEAAGELAGETAAANADRPFHFMFVGQGARRGEVEAVLARGGLDNISLHDPLPSARLNALLAACDVALLSLCSGMAGVSVPSRMYNVMAAGKPIIAVTDADSELARVIHEEDIGWVVPPGDTTGLVMALRQARGAPARLEAMGTRALAAARRKYTFERALHHYARVLAAKA